MAPADEVVNEALKRTLEAKTTETEEPFVVQARDLKLRPGFQIDKIEALLDEVEGPLRR